MFHVQCFYLSPRGMPYNIGAYGHIVALKLFFQDSYLQWYLTKHFVSAQGKVFNINRHVHNWSRRNSSVVGFQVDVNMFYCVRQTKIQVMLHKPLFQNCVYLDVAFQWRLNIRITLSHKFTQIYHLLCFVFNDSLLTIQYINWYICFLATIVVVIILYFMLLYRHWYILAGEARVKLIYLGNGAKPFSQPTMAYCQIDKYKLHWYWIKIQISSLKKYIE